MGSLYLFSNCSPDENVQRQTVAITRNTMAAVPTQSGVRANKKLCFVSGTWLQIQVTDTALLPLVVQHVEQLAAVTQHTTGQSNQR